jgi:hypothetical protein
MKAAIEIIFYLGIASCLACAIWMVGHYTAEIIVDIWKKLTYNKRMNQELHKLIAETKGKFFSVTFIKKDGTVRTINAKNQYKRLLRGGDNKVAHAGYISAVNRNKDSWFCFKPEGTVRFKCGGVDKVFLGE